MIFYFSCTGNTRWAARTIADATTERLVNIADAIKSDCHFSLTAGERIGFVFPIHGWRPPLLVLKFIEKLTVESHCNYCYALVTAGDNIGLAMDYLRKALKPKGIHVDSCFSLIMPESYVGLPFMDVDTHEREIEKKEKATQDLDIYIKVIKDRETGVEKLTRGAFPWFLSVPIGGFFAKYLITDKPFHVDLDKCISCGTCESVCPVGDITLNKDNVFPEWNHNGKCLTCFSCYHHCPVKAIEYGGRTKHKGQYYYSKNRLKTGLKTDK